MVVLNGDSTAARAPIDVNPLTIVGRLGETIDAVLRDLQPVADAELFADVLVQRRDSDRASHRTATGAPE